MCPSHTYTTRALPQQKAFFVWGALVRGVAPEDEVVPPLRGTRPQMRPLEAPRPHPRQISHNHLVVDSGAHLQIKEMAWYSELSGH